MGILNTLQDSIFAFITNMAKFYNIFIFLFFIVFYKVFQKKDISKDLILFILIFIFFNWFQLFISKRYNAYMVADLSIFIIPLAVYFLVDFINQIKRKYIKNIIRILGIYIIFNTLMSFYHHPYLNPYERSQKI